MVGNAPWFVPVTFSRSHFSAHCYLWCLNPPLYSSPFSIILGLLWSGYWKIGHSRLRSYLRLETLLLNLLSNKNVLIDFQLLNDIKYLIPFFSVLQKHAHHELCITVISSIHEVRWRRGTVHGEQWWSCQSLLGKEKEAERAHPFLYGILLGGISQWPTRDIL